MASPLLHGVEGREPVDFKVQVGPQLLEQNGLQRLALHRHEQLQTHRHEPARP